MTISRAAQTSRGIILPAIPASCQFWYTCFHARLGGPANALLLERMFDQSGLGTNMGNTTTSRPSYTNSNATWGGKPTCTTDGALNQLIGIDEKNTAVIARDLQGSSNDFTIFAAIQPAATVVSQATLFCTQNATPNTNVTLEHVGTAGASLVCTYFDSTPTLTTSSTATLSTSGPNIVEAVKSGTSLDIYVDGVKQGATVTGVSAMNKSTSNVRLFRRQTAVNRFWTGTFGGIIYCNAALASATRSLIRGWLSRCYAHPVTL